MDKKIKVLMTHFDYEIHDRGIRHVMHGLRDAGMEVVFTRFRYPEEIVATAEQEDVDAIGISSLSGGHMYVCEQVMKMLKEKKLEHILVVVGGIMSDVEVERLIGMGIKGVFRAGTLISDIVDFVTSNVAVRA
ncbi:cobalamin-dependent protein [Chloroflexota bacterium]